MLECKKSKKKLSTRCFMSLAVFDWKYAILQKKKLLKYKLHKILFEKFTNLGHEKGDDFFFYKRPILIDLSSNFFGHTHCLRVEFS